MKIENDTNLKQKAKEWICTDPNEKQFGRRIGDYVFEYKDSRTDPEIIDLTAYTISRIESTINSYGYSLFTTKSDCENIFILYGADAAMVIAECLFEEGFAVPSIL